MDAEEDNWGAYVAIVACCLLIVAVILIVMLKEASKSTLDYYFEDERDQHYITETLPMYRQRSILLSQDLQIPPPAYIPQSGSIK